jgi:IS605 OrfB family transposase
MPSPAPPGWCERMAGKNTPSAKRRLRKRRRKEARRARDINHKIAKHVVAEAERTGRGIALEDLTGIRGRVRLRKPQRATHSSWAFAQLGSFIGYKARWAGVPLVYVDPAYTSRTCAECGHIDKRTGPPRPGSRAGTADSLIMQTGTAPATSAPARGSCGDAWPRQRPPPHPEHLGAGLDANAASPPVIPVVQARRFSAG